MPPDTIPQLSLGSAALVIFLLCAAFVLLRGMTRMLLGTLILGLSTWVGFIVWQKAPTLSIEWTGKPLTSVNYGLPLVCFVITFLLIRLVVQTLARPFGKPKPERTHSGNFLPRLLGALVPTTIICLIAAALIHHAGSVAELKSLTAKPAPQDPPSTLLKLKAALDSFVPASWIASIDPLSDPSRVALARLIATESAAPRAIMVDPATGEPVPRAIIVEDPELQTLAREGKFGTLLRHPLLTEALEDPKIQSFLKDLRF